uniref:Chitin-binding type-2 domain-containing protein n=1 Tax=Strigamia maritima TaxID=126957 RepID=T1JP70_STRMM
MALILPPFTRKKNGRPLLSLCFRGCVGACGQLAIGSLGNHRTTLKKESIPTTTIIPLSLGKPLCDSLEEYFRKSKQPGAKRFKKTVTRICTAFDVVKYDGVDPIDLILPPAEDDDDLGIQDDRQRERDIDDDFSQDYDLSPQEELIAASRFRFPGRWPMNPVRFRPWRRFSSRPRPQWRVSDRRHHHEKAPKTQSVEENEKVIFRNESVEVKTSTRSEEIIVTTSIPINVVNKTDTTPEDNDNDYTDEEDYMDDDDSDPVLTDLADFVASVRFLSLNDTTHLNVIFPPSKKIATDKIDSGRPALAIEAPEELLPSSYREVVPIMPKESSLPDVYRIYTEFSCDEQHYKPGVYADIMTKCQAFHLCLPTGHGFSSATFLCPKNLRYNQRLLRCDWARSVNCSDSSRHFINNKHFRHNYTAYLQSLHTLLHGDGIHSAEENEEVNSEAKDASFEVTTRKAGNYENALNIALLGKLRSIISSHYGRYHYRLVYRIPFGLELKIGKIRPVEFSRIATLLLRKISIHTG